MQIAVTPKASAWIVVPEFPPPGWERAEARRRTYGPAGGDPRRRASLEDLLIALRRIERRSPLARRSDASSAAPLWRGCCTSGTASGGCSPSI